MGERKFLMYPIDTMYCIFLHVLEGKNLMLPSDEIVTFDEDQTAQIIFRATLNGIKFELTGHGGPETTDFNSNCIWECELEVVKRMKSDNRPVKIECFFSYGHAENISRSLIGTLLLPIRGIPAVSNLRNLQLNLIWHKLGNLTSQWRHKKPEVQILLTIINRSFVKSGQFLSLLGKHKENHDDLQEANVSETNCMLYSQKGVYVELCSHIGLIQIGNDTSVDVDIYKISVTFLSLKRINAMLEHERAMFDGNSVTCVFKYDFLGSISQTEIFNSCDNSKNIKERITMTLKSSLKSIRLYFQRIFYLPLTLSINKQLVAKYHMDFSKLLPENGFFDSRTYFSKKDCFVFEGCEHTSVRSNVPKPIVDFEFCMELLQQNPKKFKMSLPPYPVQTNNCPPILEKTLENNFIKKSMSELDTRQQKHSNNNDYIIDHSQSATTLMQMQLENSISNDIESTQQTDDSVCDLIVPSLHLIQTDLSSNNFSFGNDGLSNFKLETKEKTNKQPMEKSQQSNRTPKNDNNRGYHCPVVDNRQMINLKKYGNNYNSRTSINSLSNNDDHLSHSVELSDNHNSIEDFKSRSITKKNSIRNSQGHSKNNYNTEFVKKSKLFSSNTGQNYTSHQTKPLQAEETVPIKVHRSNQDMIYTTIAFGKNNNTALRYQMDTDQAIPSKAITTLIQGNEDLIEQQEISSNKRTRQISTKSIASVNSFENIKKKIFKSCDIKSTQTTTQEQDGNRLSDYSKNFNQQSVTSSQDFIAEKVIEELDAWKKEQMQIFLREMEEEQKQSKENRKRLEAVLEEKISTCETLNKQLEETYNEVKDASSVVKVNCEEQNKIKNATYADRFFQLEKEVRYLKKDLEEKINLFGRLQDEKITENEKLYNENVILKKTIAKLETALKETEKLTMQPEQARNLLNKLRKKTQQLSDLEVTKNHYKDQWMKSTRELNKLKQKAHKINKTKIYNSSDDEKSENNEWPNKIDIHKILTDDVFFGKNTKKCIPKNKKYVR